MMGAPNSDSNYKTQTLNDASNSQYLSDNVINPHPRFAALTRNIRHRRGSNVDIRVEKDVANCDDSPMGIGTGIESTAEFSGAFEINNISSSTVDGDNSSQVQMDAMAFGMGCCCLQVTMQCADEAQSRYLHDQLAVMAPMLHALSAATPILKGQLVATDTRWDVISQAVDDRTPSERGQNVSSVEYHDPQMAGGGVRSIDKSRYSSVSSFLGKPSSPAQLAALDALNDVFVPHDEKIFTRLVDEGVDRVLALHLAHLFIRDPLVIFDDAIQLNDSESLVSRMRLCRQYLI
jgi:glutamate--cysteine ligase catalytic subunit